VFTIETTVLDIFEAVVVGTPHSFGDDFTVQLLANVGFGYLSKRTFEFALLQVQSVVGDWGRSV